MPDIKLPSPLSSSRAMGAGDTASSHNKPHRDNHDDAPKEEENMHHLPAADREKLETQKLLDTQDEILQAVSDSDFYQLAGKQQQQSRQYPVFDADEIIIGPRLGIGGFGIVFEVAEIKLKEENRSHSPENGPAANNKNHENGENPNEEEKQRTANKIVDGLNDDEDEGEEEDVHDDQKHAEVHYDVASAREFMAQHVRRRPRRNSSAKDTGAKDTSTTNSNHHHHHHHHHHHNNNNPDGDEPEGDARYAIKRLHRTLSEYERTRGMIDMAIEAKFLQVLWHPNIGMYWCIHRQDHDIYVGNKWNGQPFLCKGGKTCV